MKLVCLQENLRSALILAERIIGKNITLPILNNILLKTEKGFLKISSTNLELGLNIWVPAKVEKEGEVTVRAKLFVDYINNLPNSKVNIEAKDNKINIKCDSFKALFLGIETKEFPIIPAIKERSKFLEIKSSVLKEAVEQVINTVSFSDNRIDLTGVFFNVKKSIIKVVATDTVRLAEKTIKEIINNKLADEKTETKFILPHRSAQELLRNIENKEKVRIYLNEGQVFFETEDTTMVSRLIEGEYVDYEQIIPKSFKVKLHLNKKDFLDAIKITSLFSSKINDIKLKTDKKSGKIEISAKDFELGETKSDIEGRIEGEDVEIAFNHRYLTDGLNNLKDEEIIFELNDETHPGFLKAKKYEDYFYIIMPLKIF